MKYRVISVVGVLLATVLCRADSTPPPIESIGNSENGRFIVRIGPKIQVFALDKEERNYRLISAFDCVSEGTPLKALISDDGRYVVTFDSGRGMGRGGDVVVVYESAGKKLKSWSLDEFLDKEDRAAVSSTESSDWWRQEVRIAYKPPCLIVLGPSEQYGAHRRHYWYQLDLETLKWAKRR